MANYVFETMTTDQAASFTSNDNLIFLNGTASSISVTDNPSTPLLNESIDLTSGTRTLRFAADQLSAASTSGHLVFSSGSDYLGIGYSAANDLSANGGVAGSASREYGFAGADTLSGSAAADTLYGGEGADTIEGSSNLTNYDTDYLFGGNGADSIIGGAGNDHIYGYDNFSAASLLANDGNDTIDAGAGKDYVQGNAGADSIYGNDDNDVLYGGGDNDTLIGGNGADYLQGNKGADSLSGGEGNDTIRGGADNDVLLGGNGADSLSGDAGNDTVAGGAGNDALLGGDGADSLVGGTGIDAYVGGAGNDLFVFSENGAVTGPPAVAATNDAGDFTITSGVYKVDEIVDFTHAQDKIQFVAATGGTARAIPTAIDYGSTGASFTNVGDARVYAQQLLDADTTHSGTEVAAVAVGSDTYLFFNSVASEGGSIDAIIKLDGVAATTAGITTADFTL